MSNVVELRWEILPLYTLDGTISHKVSQEKQVSTHDAFRTAIKFYCGQLSEKRKAGDISKAVFRLV